MKISNLLFIILLLNIATIFICTNAQGEEGKMVEEGNNQTAKNIYPSSLPNLNQSRGNKSGQTATVFNEKDLDEIMNKFKPEDFNEIMASLYEDNWNQNFPEPIQHNLQRPLIFALENLPKRESTTNVGQESQLNKGKATVIGVKRSFYDNDESELLWDNRRKVDNKIPNLNRESENNLITGDEQTENINDENIPHCSPIQQEMMDQNLTIDDWAFSIENPIVPEEFLDQANEENIPISSHTQEQIMEQHLPILRRASIAKNIDKRKKPITISVNKGKKRNRSVAQIHLEEDISPNEWLDSADENAQHSSSNQQISTTKNNIEMFYQEMERNEIQNIQPIIAKGPHVCQNCKMGYTTKNRLNRHLPCTQKENDLSDDKRPHNECNWPGCGKKFPTPWKLEQHERIHRSEKKFVCECGMSFVQKGNLIRHQQQRKIPCNKKGNMDNNDSTDKNAQYSSSDQKNIEMNNPQMEKNQIHNFQPIIAEGQYVCQNCETIFTTKGNLTKHLKSKKKPCIKKENVSEGRKLSYKFECKWPGCRKKFPYPNALELHKQSHGTERAFICQNCGEGFKRKDALAEHLNKKRKCIKKGSTKFVCQICERTFDNEKNLNQHLERTCIKKLKTTAG